MKLNKNGFFSLFKKNNKKENNTKDDNEIKIDNSNPLKVKIGNTILETKKNSNGSYTHIFRRDEYIILSLVSKPSTYDSLIHFCNEQQEEKMEEETMNYLKGLCDSKIIFHLNYSNPEKENLNNKQNEVQKITPFIIEALQMFHKKSNSLMIYTPSNFIDKKKGKHHVLVNDSVYLITK